MQQNKQAAYLIIRQGNRWTDVFRMENSQSLVIGRASSNDIPVADERASRRHAEIFFDDGNWILRDLNSRNGTLLDGSKIDAPKVLSPGNQIVVASCRMTFVHSLTDYVPPPADSDGHNDSPVSQTEGDLPPSILHRQSKASMLESQEISSLPPVGPTKTGPVPSVPAGPAPGLANQVYGNALADPTTSAARAANILPLAFELAKSSSMHDACELALSRLLQVTGCMAGGIVKIDPQSTPLITVLAAQELSGKAYHPVSESVIKTLVRDPSAILARNVISDPNLVGDPQESGSHILTTTSLIVAPIQCEGQLFGAIHLYSRLGRPDLTPDDLEVALAIAEVLSVSLQNLARQRSLETKLQSTSTRLEELEQQLGHGDWVGNSASLKVLRDQVRRVAPSQATVLIRGESGTGKELVARAIHENSPRASHPFVALNCAALSPTLLESELFGHEKGAFTGATDRKIGKFELADGGTMLLDELGEMSLEIQAKFLRVLEGQPFERLGSNKPIRSNVRVIAATNRDLELAVRDGLFRSDLYFRLRVIELRIPPLRERVEDILPLAEFFLKQFRSRSGHGPSRFSERAKTAMLAYHWPGNVRELKNSVERAHVLAAGEVAEPEDLALSHLQIPGLVPPQILPAAQVSSGTSSFESISKPGEYRERTLEDVELEHIEATLRYTQGQKNRAASILGIERSTLDRKLKRIQGS